MSDYLSRSALLIVALVIAGCGSSTPTRSTPRPTTPIPQGRPQAIEPSAGAQAVAVQGQDPVGDPNAHAPPLSEIKQELRNELVAVRKTNTTYINPLRYVTTWGRTDQGVDAGMPVG